MTDHVVRAEDNDAPILDGEGLPISELELDQVDAALDRQASVAELAADQQSWRFGHVIVDEAQDLTPMQWRMIARRTQGDSMTVVGDLAQRSIGEPGTWADHIPPSVADFSYQELTINYRAPAELNELSSAILAELAPDLQAPRSIRSVGHYPKAIAVEDLQSGVLEVANRAHDERTLRTHGEGTIAVIGIDLPSSLGTANNSPFVLLSPWQAKGLEFDSVLLVEPATIIEQEFGLSLLYVAVTRSTNELLIVHNKPLPAILSDALARQQGPDLATTNTPR